MREQTTHSGLHNLFRLMIYRAQPNISRSYVLHPSYNYFTTERICAPLCQQVLNLPQTAVFHNARVGQRPALRCNDCIVNLPETAQKRTQQAGPDRNFCPALPFYCYCICRLRGQPQIGFPGTMMDGAPMRSPPAVRCFPRLTPVRNSVCTKKRPAV